MVKRLFIAKAAGIIRVVIALRIVAILIAAPIAITQQQPEEIEWDQLVPAAVAQIMTPFSALRIPKPKQREKRHQVKAFMMFFGLRNDKREYHIKYQLAKPEFLPSDPAIKYKGIVEHDNDWVALK